MKPVFCGSFDYETRQSDLERLFSKYGNVDRVDMKSGFAFVYFDDERDAEDAIRSLDNTPFGYSKRRLSVEWSRGERGNRRDGSRSVANQKPTKTLFVINFDPTDTRIRDIEKHFEPYGKVSHVRIRRNFAFVQFETQEEATKALECTHMSKICGRVVSVEYALRDDSERGGDRRDSPRRGEREASRSRSRSPVRRRSRPSPDYGRAHSPVYDRYKGPSSNRDRSPDYGRYPSRSPVRRSLNGRSSASRSPVRRSPAARSPVRRRTRSPVRRTRSPAARSPVRRTRSPADRSPVRRTRSPADRSPVRRARSPADRSPVRHTRSPADRSPVRRSSVDRSPAGRSPNDRSPVRRSPDDRSPV